MKDVACESNYSSSDEGEQLEQEIRMKCLIEENPKSREEPIASNGASASQHHEYMKIVPPPNPLLPRSYVPSFEEPKPGGSIGFM
jgi:hypothetical protein